MNRLDVRAHKNPKQVCQSTLLPEKMRPSQGVRPWAANMGALDKGPQHDSNYVTCKGIVNLGLGMKVTAAFPVSDNGIVQGITERRTMDEQADRELLAYMEKKQVLSEFQRWLRDRLRWHVRQHEGIVNELPPNSKDYAITYADGSQ